MGKTVRCAFFEWSTYLEDWYWCKEKGTQWRAQKLYCDTHCAMFDKEMMEYIGVLQES